MAGPTAPRYGRVGIVGAGAWGTALAMVAAKNGCQVTLWGRDPALAAAINQQRRNPRYLSDARLPTTIDAVSDLAAVGACDALLLVVPAQAVRATCQTLRPAVTNGVSITVCAKGIERGSGALINEVVADVAPNHPIAVLSGPTFATEVARGLPTAVTLACADPDIGARWVATLGLPTFRPYYTADVVGTALAGAVKNVLAIACGIAIGRALGDNARAALITRGLAEMARLNEALGGDRETMMGLAGLGDLVLTSSSRQSRNFAYGLAVGERGKADDPAGGPLVEGRATAVSVNERARQARVDMPICSAVKAIVHDGAPVDDTIAALLARPFRAEAAD